MSANILTIEAAKAANIDVSEDGSGTQAVHDVVVAMRANRRSGTANTKTRGEVAWSGKKPFRQKGTGNARQGGNASPLHRGGGVVFGPRPRDYSKNVNQKTKKRAFSTAISDRINSEDVLVVDEFKVDEIKTKTFVSKLTDIAGTLNCLVISNNFTANTYLSARNVGESQLVTDLDVNTEQILGFDKIIITEDAMPTLSKRTTV